MAGRLAAARARPANSGQAAGTQTGLARAGPACGKNSALARGGGRCIGHACRTEFVHTKPAGNRNTAPRAASAGARGTPERGPVAGPTQHRTSHPARHAQARHLACGTGQQRQPDLETKRHRPDTGNHGGVRPPDGPRPRHSHRDLATGALVTARGGRHPAHRLANPGSSGRPAAGLAGPAGSDPNGQPRSAG